MKQLGVLHFILHFIFSLFFKNTYMGFLDYRKQTIRDLGISPSTCSFNPGVFVANMTEWKRQRITKQLEKWMQKNAEYVQSALSPLQDSKVHTVDSIWLRCRLVRNLSGKNTRIGRHRSLIIYPDILL